MRNVLIIVLLMAFATPAHAEDEEFYIKDSVAAWLSSFIREKCEQPLSLLQCNDAASIADLLSGQTAETQMQTLFDIQWVLKVDGPASESVQRIFVTVEALMCMLEVEVDASAYA